MSLFLTKKQLRVLLNTEMCGDADTKLSTVISEYCMHGYPTEDPNDLVRTKALVNKINTLVELVVFNPIVSEMTPSQIILNGFLKPDRPPNQMVMDH